MHPKGNGCLAGLSSHELVKPGTSAEPARLGHHSDGWGGEIAGQAPLPWPSHSLHSRPPAPSHSPSVLLAAPTRPPTTPPGLERFTVNFTITNLPYDSDLHVPHSAKLNSTQRVMTTLVRNPQRCQGRKGSLPDTGSGKYPAMQAGFSSQTFLVASSTAFSRTPALAPISLDVQRQPSGRGGHPGSLLRCQHSRSRHTSALSPPRPSPCSHSPSPPRPLEPPLAARPLTLGSWC